MMSIVEKLRKAIAAAEAEEAVLSPRHWDRQELIEAHPTTVRTPQRVYRPRQYCKRKLTEEQISQIQELYEAGGLTYRQLGTQFCTTKTTICDCILRRNAYSNDRRN
ncbi:MAG: hypothetical protein HC934_03015 [Acaryochloridaceae cyanobacterium SU_2_1]|nr:hypothetical protein [Acaryochloridaceae cyanobacterium SU_2_1]